MPVPYLKCFVRAQNDNLVADRGFEVDAQRFAACEAGSGADQQALFAVLRDGPVAEATNSVKVSVCSGISRRARKGV